MSIKRWSAKRDEKEKAIVSALREVGAEVEQLDYPCDLLVRFRARLFLLEVEGVNKHRKRAQKQLDFLIAWAVPRIHTPTEALKAIGAPCVART